MAHYDLEEQEQLDSLKAWWSANGNLVTGVVVAISLAVVGWQGWNWHQRGQSAQASAVFGVLEQAVASGDGQKIKSATGELTEKYAGTSYALMATLVAAKHSLDNGDVKTAKVQLAWAIENGKDEMLDLARLRLASLLLDEKQHEEALRYLDGKRSQAFESRFLDLKGDILLAQGKIGEARSAYSAALEKITTKGSFAADVLQQKLDSLGETK